MGWDGMEPNEIICGISGGTPLSLLVPLPLARLMEHLESLGLWAHVLAKLELFFQLWL
jgi:hypothetical protein